MLIISLTLCYLINYKDEIWDTLEFKEGKYENSIKSNTTNNK